MYISGFLSHGGSPVVTMTTRWAGGTPMTKRKPPYTKICMKKFNDNPAIYSVEDKHQLQQGNLCFFALGGFYSSLIQSHCSKNWEMSPANAPESLCKLLDAWLSARAGRPRSYTKWLWKWGIPKPTAWSPFSLLFDGYLGGIPHFQRNLSVSTTNSHPGFSRTGN